ncbi:hypothetical protein [Nostoc parmelioides]|uniref:Uncharacterized protein n=1 Tax=Nostoc parmelioides FACHB-3921 TaxID=2692909 RepID=A0ABR8BNC3_9NOSO|nr:hypothetical protein [Nostoc parmelioides]MBD2255471.1 hypothetical protein [Nostoc parmelioides FACHB-3921]
MLNQNQLRRLEASARWLREIQALAQFKQLEYYPDLTLGEAIQAVGEPLQEHDYKPFLWNTTRSQKLGDSRA